MDKKSILILLALVILGFAIRIFRITDVPLYGDELTMVYDAYSISKTGMDATGEKFPLTFRMGAGRPGGYIYFSLPFVGILGPTIFAERALSIISGLGVIILMYFLGKKLFNKNIGLVAALLAAISPWDIYLSRGGFEAHFALFLALFGVTMFLYRKYFWWAIGWGLAIHTYPTFKLTLPIVFIPLALFSDWKKILKDKMFIFGACVLIVFGGFSLAETLKSGSEERFLNLNIFSDTGLSASVIQRINYEREISYLPESVKPLFINKGVEYGRILFENYVKNLSPDFLFLRGDGNPRHNPGEMGMLYIIELPLLAAGLFLLYNRHKNLFRLILSWILIVPLATMFLPEFHGLRNVFMLPPLILTSAFALSTISKRMRIVAVVLILIQLAYILLRLYAIAPAKFASFWSSEAKAQSLAAIKESGLGVPVVLSTKTDNIEYAYPVYAKINPPEVIRQYGKFPKKYGNVTIIDR